MPMYEKSNTCCFTGHRTVPAAQLSRVVERLVAHIRQLYAEGYRRFITGGAVGFDTLAARALLVLKREYPDLHFTMMIPCANQDEKWTAAQKAEYARHKAAADELITLAEHYFDGCMQARNAAMVNESSAIIAYLTRPRSGTGQTVRLAERNGARVFNLAE